MPLKKAPPYLKMENK